MQQPADSDPLFELVGPSALAALPPPPITFDHSTRGTKGYLSHGMRGKLSAGELSVPCQPAMV